MKSLLFIGFLGALSISSVSATPSSNTVDLATALASMLERHPALSGKQAQIDAKGFQLKSAESERFPSATFNIGQDLDDRQDGTLTVKQPLWAFGRIDASIDYANTALSAEALDKIRLSRELLEDTATAYAEVLGVKEQIEIVDQNIEQHELFLEQITRRKNGRLASETDTQLAASRLTQARAQAIQMQSQYRDALMTLQTFTQLTINQVLPISNATLKSLASDETILTQVLERSADVQHKEKLAELALKDIDRQKSQLYPTVYLNVSHDLGDRTNFGNETRVSLTLESSLQGLGFVTMYRVQSSNSQLEAARKDIEVIQFDLRNRLNSLLLNRQTQRSLIDIHQSSIDTLNATLASYQRQYKSGRKEWLDVLNVQREITEQKLSQSQARNSLLINALNIMALTGDLDRLVRE
ncbi:TolC family protein [Marinomonas communis]|uniref:TolC family protein n=1 Tax=Marinomonas communis TaxID=28254 RepID=UPI001D18C093|nr:TolC family protein [Marinomonas communis]MCC4274099.1 TolC family protein [Marinomonas communis]